MTDSGVSAVEAAREFVQRVRALDRREAAVLRRNAGRAFGEARDAAWFYRLLDPRDRSNPEVPFLVATLMGLNGLPGAGDFGESVRRLAAAHRPEAVDRRFRMLLDSRRGELAYRLRQLVKLAASRGIGVDWARMLIDLRQWTHPGRRVQRRWAESFYNRREEGAEAAAVTEEGA